MEQASVREPTTDRGRSVECASGEGWTVGVVGGIAVLPLRFLQGMLCTFPLLQRDELQNNSWTMQPPRGISVELKDGKCFDQVVASEGCIIEVRGYEQIPFAPEEVASVIVNHKRWNLRDGSDIRIKCRAATA